MSSTSADFQLGHIFNLNTIGSRLRRKWAEQIGDNPVVVKELRVRMRGRMAFLLMAGYILILFLALSIGWQSLAGGGQVTSVVNKNIGANLFMILTIVQTVLIGFVMPAITGGAVTSELEKKTIEMVALSGLKPGRLVWGKHLCSFMFASMLVICSLPLAGVCLMFGGISPAEIAATYVLLLAWVFLLAAIGVFWSTMFKRTAVAVLLAYATCGVYTLFAGSVYASSQLMAVYAGGRSQAVSFFYGFFPTHQFSLAVVSVCGMHVPVALLVLLLHLLTAIALLLAATMHVRYLRADNSLWVRLLFLVVSSLLVWANFGESQTYSAPTSTSMTNTIPEFSVFFLVVLCLVSMVFATGPIRKRNGESLARYVLSGRRILKGDLGGSLAFMFLWGIILYVIFAITGYREAGFAHMTAGTEFGKACAHLCVANLSVLMATCAVGILMSVVSRQRVLAGLGVFVFLVALCLVGVPMSIIKSLDPDARGPIMQLMALSPFAPIDDIQTTRTQYSQQGAGIALSPSSTQSSWSYVWPKGTTWIVTSAVYLLMFFIVLWIASVLARKRNGVVEDMYGD